MSADVTEANFREQKKVVLSMLRNISVAESNCPTGARVSMVVYSRYTRYLFRFQEHRSRKALINAVENLARERTSERRHLGGAMLFVGRNVFKRVRSGEMIRKVAVIFTGGATQDPDEVLTAVMEYRALNIVPAIISQRNIPGISRAMEADDSGSSVFALQQDLEKINRCVLCYDPCRRSEECSFIQDPAPPQQADVDLAVVLDGSREMQADDYVGAQQLLGSVVEQLAVSPQPRRPGAQARVAVLQQGEGQAAKLEFNLQTYQNQRDMKTHLTETMRQQSGSSVLGQTLDYALREVLLKAGQARRRRVLLAVVATETAYWDRAKLRYVSQKASCEGVAVFVVAVGRRYNQTQVEELAGVPVRQHLIHVGRLLDEERGYVRRFFRVFLSSLNKGLNLYPPPFLSQSCQDLVGQEEGQTSFTGGQQEFQEHTGGQTQTDILDALLTPGRGDSQLVELGMDLNGPDAQLQTENTIFSKDACLLRQDPGGCQNYTMKWFFDTVQSECSQFWYGGCHGNANRFNTKQECETLCLTVAR